MITHVTTSVDQNIIKFPVYRFDQMNHELKKAVQRNFDVNDSHAYTIWHSTTNILGQTYAMHLSIQIYLPEYKFITNTEIDNYYRQLECHEKQHANIAQSMFRSIEYTLKDLIAQNGSISVTVADDISTTIYNGFLALEKDFDRTTDHGCRNDKYLYSSCNIDCTLMSKLKSKAKSKSKSKAKSNPKPIGLSVPVAAPVSKTMIEARLKELNLTLDQLYNAINGKTITQGGLNKEHLQSILGTDARTTRPGLIKRIKKIYG